ncbi:hypothetical protein RSP822_18150 [Ralstonia solanacearum]|uniref:hypothetical protein n=1 Tax=Ralstonia solanacearum TaxID=305 RepID=UPI000E6695DD|nr:hypothetical protein [Ralstonia solanacearum]RIJ84990.1 hypothetical protein RSP822_18150 [Ralstonia solanacearum]
MEQFIVVSVHHTIRDHEHITLWRPDDRGYTPVVPRAGLYSREQVTAHLDYYNNGDNVAVPVSVIEGLSVEVKKGFYDEGGPAVPNTRKSWNAIRAAMQWPTKYPVKPECKRGRPSTRVTA